MSRRQRRSKGSSSKGEPQRGSVAARSESGNFSTPRPAWKRWLSVFVVSVVLSGAGYYWFDYQPHSTARLERQSPADAYRTALSVNPENHDAHYHLGTVLQTQGRLDEAISHYRQAIVLSGNHAGYHNNLGAALADQGKFDEAMDSFRRAIECDPDNAEARLNFGNGLFSQDKLEEAIGHYRRAIELKPDYAKAHNNLAVALKKTGHLQEAYQHRYEAMRLERAQQGADSPGRAL